MRVALCALTIFTSVWVQVQGLPTVGIIRAIGGGDNRGQGWRRVVPLEPGRD